jgi:hypothetical protein
VNELLMNTQTRFKIVIIRAQRQMYSRVLSVFFEIANFFRRKEMTEKHFFKDHFGRFVRQSVIVSEPVLD